MLRRCAEATKNARSYSFLAVFGVTFLSAQKGNNEINRKSIDHVIHLSKLCKHINPINDSKAGEVQTLLCYEVYTFCSLSYKDTSNWL